MDSKIIPATEDEGPQLLIYNTDSETIKQILRALIELEFVHVNNLSEGDVG